MPFQNPPTHTSHQQYCCRLDKQSQHYRKKLELDSFRYSKKKLVNNQHTFHIINFRINFFIFRSKTRPKIQFFIEEKKITCHVISLQRRLTLTTSHLSNAPFKLHTWYIFQLYHLICWQLVERAFHILSNMWAPYRKSMLAPHHIRHRQHRRKTKKWYEEKSVINVKYDNIQSQLEKTIAKTTL